MANETENSGLGDNKYVGRDDFRQWLRRPELSRITGIPETERLKYEEELRKSYGSYFEREEARRALKDLEMKRLKSLNTDERKKMEKKIRLMKAFLGV